MTEVRKPARVTSARFTMPRVFRTIIFDFGHGGLIDGVYQTKGKQYRFGDRIIYEGEFNRDIGRRILLKMDAKGYPYKCVSKGNLDIPLRVRTDEANEYHKLINNCVYLSIHANAGGGTGAEVFTSIGETKADPMASIIIKHYMEHIPEMRMRSDKSDGDLDKESKFWVLVQTTMPSILIECGFMDTLSDFNFLMSEKGRQRIANAIFCAIEEIITTK